MDRKDISEFEGTKLEKIIDELIDGADFYDDLYIEPGGALRLIPESQQALFAAQNSDLSGWTKVCFGYDREGF